MADARTTELDLEGLEEALYAGCVEAIAKYREVEEEGDPAVFFAIDASPYYGTFAPSFDTQSSALAGMKGKQEFVTAQREWTVDRDAEAWRKASDLARRQSLPLYHDEVGDWSHHMIHEVKWEVSGLTTSPRYAELNKGAGDDGWIEGMCRGMLTRVCDRLVDGGAFEGVALARPFGVGYCYGDEPLVVCRAILPA